ncbi:MAG: ribosomal protein S18-alanine N-acetyltransferase [Clostridia bacterium]|nr:ribosomal protein S18-alanine N-acetyltransferase [Clostridia bacterium]
MKISVREIAKSEACAAAEIEKACLSTCWSEHQIASLPENAVYLAVFDEATMCGIASMYCVFEEGQIMNVAVSENYRGNGLADVLMQALILRAIDRECERITLEVAENNIPAIKLYEKHGFVAVGKRKGFYKNTDGIVMEKLL